MSTPVFIMCEQEGGRDLRALFLGHLSANSPSRLATLFHPDPLQGKRLQIWFRSTAPAPNDIIEAGRRLPVQQPEYHLKTPGETPPDGFSVSGLKAETSV